MRTHTVDLRVRYQETDQMGVVYYANYLIWFEVARTEFFRAMNLDYKKLEDDKQIYLPVVEARCRYRSPVRYDDQVSISAGLSSVKNARINFEYEVKCGEKLSATGTTEHTFVNSEGAPIPVPSEIRQVLLSAV